MVVQDSSCTAKTPTHPISRSSSVASLSGGHDPHQQVYETIHGYQSPYNTSHHPTEVGSQGHLSVNGLVQEPSSGRSSPSIFSFNRPRLFTHGTSSSFGSAGKMGAVHPTSDAATANQMKISPAMSAALKELSIEALEEEMSKVDCNPLAASIRQFAIPIEIAQVYMGQNTDDFNMIKISGVIRVHR
ncbi:hypothetical protein BGZ54_004088 [Gamsiella multidivaricata]|nr:hypothetical protein BGZ54_004088 [Gamsiella multidivaricata]